MTTSSVFSFQTKGHYHNQETLWPAVYSSQEGNSYTKSLEDQRVLICLWGFIRVLEKRRWDLDWTGTTGTAIMPSHQKILLFLSSALATAISVVVLGICMSRTWVETTMDCTRNGTNFSNGSAVVNFSLFDGFMTRTLCPLFGGQDQFEGKYFLT